MKVHQEDSVIHILLADDDKDDHYFFNRVLKSLPNKTELQVVDDGEKLMTYLIEHANNLPQVLFLDQNMPRKNGSECLNEIKSNELLKDLPVIVYSTDIYQETEDFLYNTGAHYYVRKTGLDNLKKVITRVLHLIATNQFERPIRSKFIFTPVEI